MNHVSNIEINNTSYGVRATAIPFGNFDSTSTSTEFTATVQGITELSDGVCCYLTNNVVKSASGFTIEVNSLGALPVYSTQAAETRLTTGLAKGYTYLFVYNSSRVEGGCWDCYYGYSSSIGYQIRTASMTKPTKSKFYRYRILFSSPDGLKWIPSNTSSSTNATSSRTVNQDKIDPWGDIRYYSTTTAISADATPAASYLYQQTTLTLGYSFNTTGAALTLTTNAPVYVKCAPQTDGSAIIDSTTPIVQALPSTEDGKIYIFLGVAYSATAIEMLAYHPVYYYKGGAIRIWTNTAVPTKTSDLTNDSGFITSSSIPSAATATPLMDGTAAVGSSSKYAKEDHVHPSDTNKEDKLFVINVTESNNTFTADHTVAEIDAAVTAGKKLICMLDGYGTYQLGYHEPGQYCFFSVDVYDELGIGAIIIMNDGTSDSVELRSALIGGYGESINSETSYILPTYDEWDAIQNIQPSNSNPLMDGTAAQGSSSRYARQDHVHPSDTSKMSTSHPANSITSAMITGWNGKTNRVLIQMTNNGDTLSFTDENNNSLTPAQVRAMLNNKQNLCYIVYGGREYAKSDYDILDAADFWYFIFRAIGFGYFLSLYWDEDDEDIYIDEAFREALTLSREIGQTYAICNTAASTTAKTASVSDVYWLIEGGVVVVKFANDVPASSTLNIDSQGAKAIYNKGAAITAGVIKGGDTATFMYDGSYYQLLSIDRWQDKADLHGSTSGYFNASEMYIYDQNGTYNINRYTAYDSTDDVLKLVFTDSLAGDALSYTFNGDGDKVIATTDDVDAAKPLIATVSYDENDGEWSCDTSNADIYAAWQAGRDILVYDGNELIYTLETIPRAHAATFSVFDAEAPYDRREVLIDTINNVQSVDVYTYSYQDALTSGTNIKTINNQSLLGSGNIALPTQLKVGSVAGKMYRNNVGGTGNFTVSGNSGCIPNLTAGTFLVAIYAKSSTQSYKFRFNFGSITYDLETTNGEILDTRTVTISSASTFSGSVVGTAVASGTILYVVMYNYLTPVTTIGPAAVTNRYADLDGTPTIPTVNNGTLTIQSHGTTVGTFTANQSGNTTADITTTVVTVSTTGAVSQAMDAYKFYKFTGSPTSLTLTLNSVGSGLAMYGGKFTANSSGCTMTLPSGVTVAPNAPTIEGGKTYEFNIADNVLLMVEV